MNTPNYKNVRINSDTRVSGTPTNFTCQFINHDIQKIIYYTVTSVSFANVFDNIDGRLNNKSEPTNVITFFSTLGGNLSAIIPIGQYNITELAAILSTVMTNAMSALAGSPIVTVSVVNNKLNFITTGDTIGLLEISPIGSLMGALIDSSVGANITADSKPALQGEQIVYVHSRELGFSNTLLGSDLMVSSFVEIPITVPYGTMQTYQMDLNNGAVMYSRPTSQGTIHIKLRSPDGHILTLPNNQKVIISLKAWY